MSDRTPYFDHLPIAAVAAMDADDAREYVAARMRAAAPQYPPHGAPVGRIVLELHGQVCEAVLLSTGRHCRSFGVEISGEIVGVMGIDRAFSRHVSPAVRRPCSLRHLQC